jgi:phosphoglycerate dehydrogenase-like enzyme
MVLYLPMPRTPEPWRTDFRDALADRHQFTDFDPSRSFDAQVTKADIVVSAGWPIDPGWIDEAAKAGLRLWQLMSVGTDGIDLERFWARSVPVANTPGPLSATSVAEHALLLMLACARRLKEAQSDLEAGRFWAQFGEELAGRTVGIVGMGASGSRLAGIASGLEMQVLVFDIRPLSGDERQQIESVARLDDLLGRSDFVSLHVPLTGETQHMIGERELGTMKPNAYLINVARGGVVEEAALLTALTSGTIAGAGLDVFAQEPLPRDHPLLALSNVVMTPHIAGVTLEVSKRRATAAAENINRVEAGEPPKFLLLPNPSSVEETQ